jgi:hypothetical protein
MPESPANGRSKVSENKSFASDSANSVAAAPGMNEQRPLALASVCENFRIFIYFNF